MSIHIETRGNVQRHASVEHDNGRVQDAREQSEHVVERSRLERPHFDDRLLADTIVNAKLHHPELAAIGFRGVQAILLGKALRTSVDASAAVG